MQKCRETTLYNDPPLHLNGHVLDPLSEHPRWRVDRICNPHAVKKILDAACGSKNTTPHNDHQEEWLSRSSSEMNKSHDIVGNPDNLTSCSGMDFPIVITIRPARAVIHRCCVIETSHQTPPELNWDPACRTCTERVHDKADHSRNHSRTIRTSGSHSGTKIACTCNCTTSKACCNGEVWILRHCHSHDDAVGSRNYLLTSVAKSLTVIVKYNGF